MAWKFGMAGIFLGFVWSARDFFLAFDFYPHLIFPVTWNPEYLLPPPPHLAVKFWARKLTYRELDFINFLTGA